MPEFRLNKAQEAGLRKLTGILTFKVGDTAAEVEAALKNLADRDNYGPGITAQQLDQLGVPEWATVRSWLKLQANERRRERTCFGEVADQARQFLRYCQEGAAVFICPDENKPSKWAIAVEGDPDFCMDSGFEDPQLAMKRAEELGVLVNRLVNKTIDWWP